MGVVMVRLGLARALLPLFSGAVLSACGVGARGGDVRAPGSGGTDGEAGALDAQGGASGRSLPQQATVEILPSGALRVDGLAVLEADLTDALRALHEEGIKSAVIWVERGAPRGVVEFVRDELSQAGFEPVRRVERDVSLRVALKMPRMGRRNEPHSSPLEPKPKEENPVEAAPTPEVVVTSMGLHIGGGPNDEATRRPILDAIEPHFGQFARCFAKADADGQNASFGVDLHVGLGGGVGQIREFRSRLGGKEFQDCVLEVFLGIELPPPPEKAWVISYSLLFKPTSK